MIRVLHSVSNMARAGIETMLMNYYRKIDRSQIQFDFLANKPVPGEYDEEIRSMGGRVFVSPGLNPLHFPKYRRYVAQLVANNPDIRIVHAHNEAMGYYALRSARDAGIQVRIAHAHNTQIIRDYKYPLKILCKQLLPGAATDYWSCGRDAGIYYYGKKRWYASGFLLRNAIDTEKFAFRPETRCRLRQEHKLGDSFVIGHVGRFNLQKNHTRLIDIFASVAAADPKARLVLIGVGELEQPVLEKVRAMRLVEKVLFLGQMANVNEWYQAMDCFVLPSLFEGLPVVGVEAQAAGLPCVVADRFSHEVDFNIDTVEWLKLEDGTDAWADALERAVSKGRAGRQTVIRAVEAGGFDSRMFAQKICVLYEKSVSG